MRLQCYFFLYALFLSKERLESRYLIVDRIRGRSDEDDFQNCQTTSHSR